MNPGPKILPSRLYMLSSKLNPAFSSRLEQRLLKADLLYLVKRPQMLLMTSPKSRRFAPALRARTGKAAKQVIKLLLRSYNRLRLYLGSAFFTS